MYFAIKRPIFLSRSIKKLKTKSTVTRHARDLSRWERSQGIDPNQGLGHERRPTSSARDAAQLEHEVRKKKKLDYPQWLNNERKRLRADAHSPLEEWRNVNDDIGIEFFKKTVGSGLKNSGKTVGKAIGKTVISGMGLIWDYIIQPNEADG